MKRFILALLLALAFAGMAILLPLHTDDSLPALPSEPLPDDIVVKNEFDAGFRASCVVFNGSGSVSGSGVLLDSGFIITNKHVIDSNKNGYIDDFERRISVRFFVPTEKSYRATVIAWPPESWYSEDGNDFAILSPDADIKSDISLISEHDYGEIKVGTELFVIGSPMGVMPPHLYVGYRSTDTRESFHRASSSVYFGNSGGGVFLMGTHKVIGFVARLKFQDIDSRRFIIPQWMEYVHAHSIRAFTYQNRLEFMTDAQR